MNISKQNHFTCNYCSEIISDHEITCAKCGYPLKGSLAEQQNFISLKGRMKYELRELKTKIENAQITFYVLSGLFFLVGIASYFALEDKNVSLNLLIENLILCIIFLALGGWAKTKPVICILLGLFLYIFIQLIGMIGGYTGPMKGIIIKVLVVVLLIKGLASAFEAERIKKEHNLS